MAIDVAHWKKGFRKLPAWTCPTCAVGHLGVIDKLLCEESGPSARERDHDAWDPDWIQNRFAGLMKCNNPACEEICSISGLSSIDYDEHYEEDIGWTQVFVDYYKPHSISPAPHIFRLIEAWPEAIREELKQAFALYWVDLDAAANKLRAGVEALLNDRGVAQYARPQKGKKRARLNLHTRIERFRDTDADAAEFLMAIKWIGNHGSHGGMPLRREDILTAAELMEHALLKVYAPSNDPILRAKAINKRRGPVKAPRPRTQPR